jgi:uncharacterized protein (TIGR04168 family)
MTKTSSGDLKQVVVVGFSCSASLLGSAQLRLNQWNLRSTATRNFISRVSQPRAVLKMDSSRPSGFGPSGFGAPRERLAQVRQGCMRVILVGDVHDQWNEVDEAALAALSPDVVLFVGDYGNENVPVVRRIAKYAETSTASVAAVTGNHDAFYSMTNRGRENCPYNADKIDRVKEQLELLASFNPGYRSIPVKEPFPFAIVGGRPFSWGGPFWKHNRFYRQYFQVHGMSQSAQRIADAVLSAERHRIIFVSHQGPTGLGDQANSPCGRDWGDEPGGDWGDDDLRQGIVAARKAGKAVPLVVFGHMHAVLHGGSSGFRTMLWTERDGPSGQHTVMVNAAVVPRHKKRQSDRRSHQETLCQFTIVEIGSDGYVETVEQVWATARGEIAEARAMLENAALV